MTGFLLRFGVLLVVLGFATGYASTGYADEPPACPMFDCKTVNYFWDGSVNGASAYFRDQVFTPTSQGMMNLFTPSSYEKLNDEFQLNTGKDFVLDFYYDKCEPWCGKDTNGVWQAIQEVYIPSTAKKDNFFAHKQFRASCVSNGTTLGPTSTPSNANKNKNSPPGYSADPPFGGD